MVLFVVEKSLILLLLVLSSVFSFAQKKPAQPQARQNQQVRKSQDQTLSWDLGAAAGTYGGYSYSQIDLGLNWHFNDFLNWRNVFFNRFGTAEVQASGLDSSFRFEYADQSEGGGLSYRLFAGPGVRISTVANTGYFGEAGAVVRFGGLNIGAGVKALQYSTPGKDSLGRQLPSTDLSYFLILSGGGVL